jgi:hypothetical protein
MFVVDSKKWHPALAPGQERLLIELWLEALAADTAVLDWPPVCSTAQTLRNLLATLVEVERDILYAYHVWHLAEEAGDRLAECAWLKAAYSDDLAVLDDLLTRLRDIHKKKEKLDADAERSRAATQAEARKTAASFLRAFIAKVDRDGMVGPQVDHLRLLTANAATDFSVLARAVGELVNDLVHLGHSRDHLHGWMVGAVLRQPAPLPANPLPLLNRFDAARSLGQRIVGGCEVMFMVTVPVAVPDADGIRFVGAVPNTFPLLAGSPFLKTQKRFAIVTVPQTLDCRAATEQAHRHLLRYLHSTRLDHLSFSRDVAQRAAVRIVATGSIQEVNELRSLPHCELHNDELFYATPREGRNEGTFAELDRAMYWLEQARRWDEVGRLLALWTALEFLFSKTTQPAAEAIQELMPAYLVPNYARSLLLDLWAFIEHVPDITLPLDLEAQLEVQPTGVGTRRRVNLVKLLEECLKDDATGPLLTAISGYPILMRKYHRVRLLDPTPKDDMPIRRCLSRFEKAVTFDLRFAYRARNTIVHDAAIQIVQIDRLIQRLNWMLSTALDTLLFQFAHNPTLSLSDLHGINKVNTAKWNKRLKEKEAIPLAEIVDPPQPGLSK